nr:hypothetical protein [Micromonospora sp. DSM 115978]
MSWVDTVLVFAGIPVCALLFVFGFAYAPGDPDPARSRIVAWINPGRVALLGTVAVILLLTLPISVRAPGDHESMTCGNAWRLDLGPAHAYGDERAGWERAYRSCTSDRIDRIAQAVGVVTVTFLITTVMTRRHRRHGSSDG